MSFFSPTAAIPSTYLDTDGTLAANSDVKVATQKAVKTYVGASGGGTPTVITVANEASDTTCFLGFFTDVTGNLGPKTNTALSFNASTGVLTLTSPIFITPVLGTPASGALTNCTGTASGLTAGNVTTNANLTGPVTSSGNATSIANSVALPGNPTTTTQAPGDNSTKMATTAYADNAAISKGSKEACKYVTTAALPTVVYSNGTSGVGATLTGVALAALSVDSSSPAVGERVLVKNQVSTFQNGPYVVTATGSGAAVFVLTRTTDFNEATDILTGMSIFILAGTVNASTTWDVNSSDAPVMGTDPITFAQSAGPGSTVGGNGIAITGNSVAINTAVTVDLSTAQALVNKTYNGATITTCTGTLTLSTFTLTVTATASVGGANTGDETASTLGATLNGSAAATPNNTDIVATADSSVLKKITWTNIKAFLKTYFDTLYQNALGYTAENTANKDATGGYAGLTLFKINFKNALNTFTSFFTNANTAARTYTFQDRNGTIADDTDLALKVAIDNAAWLTSFTPVVTSQTGTITTSSASCRYKVRNGKTVSFFIVANITTNDTGATGVSVTLPVAYTSGFNACGRATNNSGKSLQCISSGGQSMLIYNYDNSYPGSSGESLTISGVYETT